MSDRVTTGVVPPDDFVFTPENLEQAQAIIAKYPEGRQASALLPLMDLAQRQNGGWVPKAAMVYLAQVLKVPPIRVYEVATFYAMYNLEPKGRHVVEVCTTTPCWLRGSAEVVAACERRLGIRVGETADDGEFTLVETECLGACVNAPVARIGEHYYEDLDADSIEAILDGLSRAEQPRPGPQIARHASAPASGPTTLVGRTGES